MIKVLLLTRAEPERRLGGPGRYVPMLLESFRQHYPESDVSVSAFLGKKARQYIPGLDASSDRLDQATPPRFFQRFRSVMWREFSLAARRTYVVTRLNRAALNYQWQCQVQRILTNHKPDLVHCHDFSSVSSLPSSLPVPVILTNHFKGSLYREAVYPNCPELRSRIWARHHRRVEVKAICRARALILPSESALELLIDDFNELESQIRAKAHIVYSGIADPLRPPSGPIETPRRDSNFVVNVSNHIPDKGLAISLRIFAELQRRHPTWRFVNFGLHGSLTDSLRALSEDLGIAKAVDFRGLRPNTEVRKALLDSVLVLHTPVRVVFDLSLLEAMAMAKAVVATNIRGNIEALGPSYPLTVSPQDAALNHNQLTMIDDQKARGAVGMTLRHRYLSHFQPKEMVYSHVALWKRLVGPAMREPRTHTRLEPDPAPLEANFE